MPPRLKCELCGRENQVNFHHLIPRTLHTNKWFKKRYTKAELSKGIMVCKYTCHREIHNQITEKELGKNFNTLEKLLQHHIISKYVIWIKKQNKLPI